MKNIIILLFFIGILSSCSSNDSEVDIHEFVPEEVSVGIKSGTNINEIFDFVNQFDHKVDNINSLTFKSDLPSEGLHYALHFLNEKSYTNHGINWFVTTCITKQIR